MKTAISTFLLSMVLLLAACGGGSSSSDGGTEPPSPPDPEDVTVPQDISGSYSGNFEGSGTNSSGVYTCSGTFDLDITQSGSTITVVFSVTSSTGSGTARCTEPFSFSGNGTYNSTNGAIAILSTTTQITASINGAASELAGKITMIGNWSTTETNSASVIASGTWSAESK